MSGEIFFDVATSASCFGSARISVVAKAAVAVTLKFSTWGELPS